MGNTWFPTNLGKYVYLKSLEIGSPPEREVAQFVKRELVFNNDISDPNTDFYEKVSGALEILKKIATNEEKKEQQAINFIKEKIQTHINNPKLPLKIKIRLTEHLNALNNIYHGINQKDFNLIKDINIIEQDLKLFNRRLEEITNIPDDPRKIFTRLEYRQESELDQFIRNFGLEQNIHHKSDEKIAATLKKLIQNTVKDEFNDIPGAQLLLINLLYIDFMDKLQNEQQQDIYQLSQKTLQDELKKYYKRNTSSKIDVSDETELIQLLKNNHDETKHLLKDLSTFLGIEFISEKKYNQLLTKQEELMSKKTRTNEEKKQLENIKHAIQLYNEKIYECYEKFLIFRFQNNTSHGFLDEIRRTIERNGINIDKNVGIDNIIPLGLAYFGIDEQKIKQELLKTSREISNIIGDNFTQIQQSPITLETFDTAVENEKTMNQQIRQELDNSAEAIKTLKQESEQSFISFESLKLSRTHENGVKSDEAYKGRTMNILSALTKLYAAPGFSSALMNKDLLITFLLNISDATLGSQNKSSLETYLSLFAGILMFDDVSDIATDALKNFANEIPIKSSTQILHVYSINNMFFPMSIILNNIIQQVSIALQSMLTLTINYKNTAKASLTTKINFDKNSHGPYAQSDWQQLAKSTIQNTQIRITFLAGFTDYVSQFYEALSPSI